jgi:hypothetical protein
MMTPPALVVLAAGMGSRYGGLKQLDAFGPSGETIIDYSIFDAIRANFGKTVFVIRKDIEQAFKQTVGARFEKLFPVHYVFQEIDRLPANFSVPEGRTKPWGTTHAILMAENIIREPFGVINADDFYGEGSYRVLADHLRSDTPDYAMVGFVLRNTLSDFGSVARGLCKVDSNGMLEEIVELTNIERQGSGARNTDPSGVVTDLSGNEAVSMNMWGFSPSIFSQLREQFEMFLAKNHSNSKTECYIPNTVNAIVSSGQARVRVLQSVDAWFGVTYKQDREGVAQGIRRLIGAGSYPESLWS